MQGAEHNVSDQVGVDIGSLRGHEGAEVAVPEPVDRVVVLVVLGGLRRNGVAEFRHQALVAADHLDDRVQERKQPVPVRGALAERRRAEGVSDASDLTWERSSQSVVAGYHRAAARRP